MGHRGDRRLVAEHRPDLAGQRVEPVDEPPAVAGTEVAHPTEVQRQQGERHRRRGEALGRGDRHLRPGVDVDARPALPRDGAARGVDDADDVAALALDLLHRGQGVERLARLADRHVQGLGVDDRVAVAELGRGLGVGRDAAQALDQQRPCQPGVVRRPAAQDLDPPHAQHVPGRQVEAAQVGGGEAPVEPPAQRLGDGGRLLVDLLVHVVLVAGQVERGRGHLGGGRALVGGPGVEGERAVRVGVQHRHLVVVEVDDLVGVAHQGGHVRRDVVGAAAHAQHDGAAVAGHDDAVGLAVVDHGQPVGADDQGQGLAHGLLERQTSAARRPTSWAITSVSVSDTSSTPSATSLARSSAAFSTMPLWTTATWPEASVWGWALTSVGSPWVAQRVWPMPTPSLQPLGQGGHQVVDPTGPLVDLEPGRRRPRRRRPSRSPGTPAVAGPRPAPARRRRVPMYPTMPHMSCSLRPRLASRQP